MKTQNYKNHPRFHFLYHYVLAMLVTSLLIASVIFYIQSMQTGDDMFEGILFLLSAIILVISYFLMRSFALRAQDRAIRAEENLRHFALTGKLLDSRITMAQVIGLRFAPDEEFILLAKRAAEEGLKQKEIKLAIQQWKGDYNRA